MPMLIEFKIHGLAPAPAPRSSAVTGRVAIGVT